MWFVLRQEDNRVTKSNIIYNDLHIQSLTIEMFHSLLHHPKQRIKKSHLYTFLNLLKKGGKVDVKNKISKISFCRLCNTGSSASISCQESPAQDGSSSLQNEQVMGVLMAPPRAVRLPLLDIMIYNVYGQVHPEVGLIHPTMA